MAQMTLLLTVIAALSSTVTAVTCNAGETYCGSRLLKVDTSNRKAIESALTTGRQPIDDAHVQQSVFWCVPAGIPAGDSGLLFVTYCGPTNVCFEGGALGGVSDARSPTSGSTLLPKV
ncbi:hypothetical protein Cob_v009399 [Colletotrichum orbiculare MAFF 240422]|uniref:Uncharacterized protein n=1 Tax=Colletotrichum orbiculare (strain 104-T / ATCC 96160 / CBS 514.97 / LARS 414 / MAFF 240422) TaxID=1213857 RepID=A0A484FKH7_COLOR|nr:hypothetical protein Cob_v009399 [Colletotrichum orbiculare MAFF 240422]